MYNFNKNLQAKSHPLEISSDEDESDGNDDRSSPIFLLNTNSSTKNDLASSLKSQIRISNNFANNNNSSKIESISLKEEPPVPPKREKRLAPKLPENKPVVKNSFFVINDNVDKSKNFYIYVDHVKWYYKGDKKSKNSKYQAAQSLTSSSTLLTNQTDNLTSSNDININVSSYSASNDINDLNNNIFNTNRPNIHNISSKKWFEFNKYDSYNLELEYRDMMTKRNLNISVSSKPVQVLENLYEVNLETKKCYSIYWKSINF
jgi:hypothetical protein